MLHAAQALRVIKANVRMYRYDEYRPEFHMLAQGQEMINPLSFWMDVARRDHWHICDDNGPLCGAELSDTEWHLPDESFVNINMCLDCWERLASRVTWSFAYTIGGER